LPSCLGRFNCRALLLLLLLLLLLEEEEEEEEEAWASVTSLSRPSTAGGTQKPEN
jgi:hypothetical protein